LIIKTKFKLIIIWNTYLITLLEIRTFLLPVTLYSKIEASAWFLSLCKFICCGCYIWVCYKWKSIEANQYILNVIYQGYRLPFKTPPVNISLENNRSAKENKSFVSDEIDKLLMKGCISRVELKPHVVNPLTVKKFLTFTSLSLVLLP
jgi:hypothetical protein